MHNINEKLNTKILGKEFIYLEEIRFYSRLYKRIIEITKM
jgi:hypothetical protein